MEVVRDVVEVPVVSWRNQVLDEEEEEWEDGLVEQWLVEVEVREEIGLAVAIVG